MDIRRQYTMDPALEVEGAWVDIGEGAELKVARAGNARHKAEMQKRRGAARFRGEKGDLPDADIAEVFADTILLDWRGITEAGEPVQYTRAKAVEYLMLPDFRAIVTLIATNMDHYRAAQVKEDAAAVKASSRGRSGRKGR